MSEQTVGPFSGSTLKYPEVLGEYRKALLEQGFDAEEAFDLIMQMMRDGDI